MIAQNFGYGALALALLDGTKVCLKGRKRGLPGETLIGRENAKVNLFFVPRLSSREITNRPFSHFGKMLEALKF